MKILIFIIPFIVSFIWGFIQPEIFPIEKFGLLFLFTSFIGGYLIGKITSKILDYID